MTIAPGLQLDLLSQLDQWLQWRLCQWRRSPQLPQSFRLGQMGQWRL